MVSRIAQIIIRVIDYVILLADQPRVSSLTISAKSKATQRII